MKSEKHPRDVGNCGKLGFLAKLFFFLSTALWFQFPFPCLPAGPLRTCLNRSSGALIDPGIVSLGSKAAPTGCQLEVTALAKLNPPASPYLHGQVT